MPKRLKAKLLSVGRRTNEAEWNFSGRASPEELEACYHYEYARESTAIRAEVEASREKRRAYDAAKDKFMEWCKENPPPSVDQRQAFKEWGAKARKVWPPIGTRLMPKLHFLFECAAFPETPWQSLTREAKEEIWRRFSPFRRRWGHTAEDLAGQPILIQCAEAYFGNPLALSPEVLARLKQPDESGCLVFSWYWARSDRMLLEDFRRYLKENRPASQPPLERTSERQSGRTSPRDLLKLLGAWRLLRAFGGDIGRARFHSVDPKDKPLYKFDSAWLKAANRAKAEIPAFEARMLTEPLSVG